MQISCRLATVNPCQGCRDRHVCGPSCGAGDTSFTLLALEHRQASPILASTAQLHSVRKDCSLDMPKRFVTASLQCVPTRRLPFRPPRRRAAMLRDRPAARSRAPASASRRSAWLQGMGQRPGHIRLSQRCMCTCLSIPRRPCTGRSKPPAGPPRAAGPIQLRRARTISEWIPSPALRAKAKWHARARTTGLHVQRLRLRLSPPAQGSRAEQQADPHPLSVRPEARTAHLPSHTVLAPVQPTILWCESEWAFVLHSKVVALTADRLQPGFATGSAGCGHGDEGAIKGS